MRALIVAMAALVLANCAPTLPQNPTDATFERPATSSAGGGRVIDVDLSDLKIADFEYPEGIRENCFGGDYNKLARVAASFELIRTSRAWREMFLAYNSFKLMAADGTGYFELLVREGPDDKQQWSCKRIEDMILDLRRDKNGALIKFTLDEEGMPIRMQVIPSGAVTGFDFHEMEIMTYPGYTPSPDTDTRVPTS